MSWKYFAKIFDYFLFSSLKKINRGLAIMNVEMVELTRWLMGCVIGGKSVTQPITGTKKTLLDVCNSLLRVEQLINLPNSDLDDAPNKTQRFLLDPKVESLLESVESPEFHWQAGTLLWECLMDIGNVINCIPRLYLDLRLQASTEIETEEDWSARFRIAFDKVNEITEEIEITE